MMTETIHQAIGDSGITIARVVSFMRNIHVQPLRGRSQPFGTMRRTIDSDFRRLKNIKVDRKPEASNSVSPSQANISGSVSEKSSNEVVLG